ncbi:cobalamin-binding protein [Marinimicrobium agarilyticum]|uniref:cobalamin-binding protein n=1 Tax=Marinimicrobium agarilyticum TaxID=306546 RepID=UPI001FDF1DF3|nr:cobalamin-binding protein [Marinimicrobium agarilyticum]
MTGKGWQKRAPGMVGAIALLCLATVVQAEVRVTDFQGRTVTLEKPAERIIALAPHIVENAYSAGAGDKLVAAVNYSDFPPEAKDLPQLGGYKAVSVEAIVALKPDLVLVWRSGNGDTLLRQLERLGLTVYVDEPRTLEDVARAVRDIGVLAGSEPEATENARAFTRRLEGLRAEYSGQSPVTVLYQVWNQPLQTLNGEHLVSDVIRLCGGRNAYADAEPIAPKINMETVLERDPHAIVASGMGDNRPEWLDEWKEWPGLTAVKQDNLFFVPPDLIQRHTFRILDGAELLCRHLSTARRRLSAP